MRFFNLFNSVRTVKMCITPYLLYVKPKVYKNVNLYPRHISTSTKFRNSNSDDEQEPEFILLENINVETNQKFARDILYKTSQDILLNRIYNCVSVEDLFRVFENNSKHYKPEHFVQTVLVLWDLRKIFHEYNLSGMNRERAHGKFLEALSEDETFQKMLLEIERKVCIFDVDQLSYTLLYLNKLGLKIESDLLQLMCKEMEGNLMKKFKIAPASRFLEAVFSDHCVRSYLMAQSLMPLVFRQIDLCYSNEDLKHLTVSLNQLNRVVTSETINKYKAKITILLDRKLIKSKDYNLILHIILLLNYPAWRNQSSVLISRCILTIKDHLNILDMHELLILHEVFFKIQEPGSLLSDLQRCSFKFLQQMDDVVSPEKIALFLSVAFFTSPQNRSQLQNILEKYVRECNDIENLISLRRLLSYVRITDSKVSRLYWDKILESIKNRSDNVDLLNLAINYVYFHNDMHDFRHKEFESEFLKILKQRIHNYNLFPRKMTNVLCFTIVYSSDLNFLETLVNYFEENSKQFNSNDCVKITSSLRLLNSVSDKYLKQSYVKRIDEIVDKILERESNDQDVLRKTDSLLRSYIVKGNPKLAIVDKLLLNYRSFGYMSSKMIESLTFFFISTNTLVPEVIENMVNYSVNNRNNMLGFNMEKILNGCFSLGYCPENPDFFSIAADIIIRDQERMTGLSVLHAAFAMCFFNKLPKSIISSIFNVQFMEKLDSEFRNCYWKDKYPQWVRSNLAQLNRAVCLDYPEANVPWFHQKFMDEANQASLRRHNRVFPSKVKQHLIQLVHLQHTILENVVTPYGYVIDFVIFLDVQGKVTTENSEIHQKVAILLIPPHALTRFLVQLSGKYQLKKRHLEMLGYRVVSVYFTDWINLFYSNEKVEFLSKLIWPRKTNRSFNA